MSDPPTQPTLTQAPTPALPVQLEYQSPRAAAAARPVMPWLYRFAYFAGGVALPVVCFLAAADETPLSPDHQSGGWDDKPALLLETDVGWPFLPLLAYAMVCMALVVVAPLRFARSFAVRLGIYGGVLLALQYSLLMACVLFVDAANVASGDTLVGALVFVGFVSVPVGVLMLLNWLNRRFGVLRVAVVLAFLAVLGAGIYVSVLGEWALPEAMYVAFVGGLGGAPAFALAAYGCMSRFVWRYAGAPSAETPSRRVNPANLFLGTGWIVAYMWAWRLAVRNAVGAYAALPTQPSGCYVCTAAARGHRRVVRSEVVTLSDGTPFPVNRQMRRLKCAEIALRVTSPRLHRVLRGAYDRYGPPLAREIDRRGALVADMAFLLLLPLEWSVVATLRLLLPRFGALCGRLYPSAVPARTKPAPRRGKAAPAGPGLAGSDTAAPPRIRMRSPRIRGGAAVSPSELDGSTGAALPRRGAEREAGCRSIAKPLAAH